MEAQKQASFETAASYVYDKLEMLGSSLVALKEEEKILYATLEFANSLRTVAVVAGNHCKAAGVLPILHAPKERKDNRGPDARPEPMMTKPGLSSTSDEPESWKDNQFCARATACVVDGTALLENDNSMQISREWVTPRELHSANRDMAEETKLKLGSGSDPGERTCRDIYGTTCGVVHIPGKESAKRKED
ncbi:unnamed protein product [Soboliphyme baturini]|uniref:Uncharacterized protein n=1 Tax=Soboliphyme baturini TaxID=241478 RepID=A0A183IT37_9BILA|nr:unnamed protein product [Soboliphyme baturini]